MFTADISLLMRLECPFYSSRFKVIMNRRQLSIVMVTPQLSIGGAEAQVVELAIRLKQRGHGVTVLSSGGILVSSLTNANIEHVSAPVNSKHPLRVLQTAAILQRKIAKVRGTVILHAHAVIPSIACWLVSRVRRNTFVFTTGHGWSYEQYPKVARIMAFTSKKVIAVSGKLAEQLVKAGLPQSLVTVIFNSVDVELFANVPIEERARIRAEWHVNPEICLLGIVSRISEERKGHRIFLEALASLSGFSLPMRAVFVGDGSLRPELEEVSRRLGIADQVIFSGNRTDIPSVMKALDVIVLPSFWEGLPIAILEAMAAGRPVIATRVGGIPEVVVDGQTGLLIPPGDIEALAKAILILCNNPEQRIRMGQAAQCRARSLFDVKQMVEQIEKLYLWESFGM